ncbi:unnamed protein product [Cylicocyclus nassatus]|uniref:SANT domain-containing protein n=1 Tax=Cylicocyclus nassatus TaxID=53992 RepID=A0AA36MGY9_CYLNA|nr:unnamed protein product [Cylicocyclus nassatus]
MRSFSAAVDKMTPTSGGSESSELITCINCRQLIQHKLHIRCCECSATICIDCFSYGCETGSHSRGHNYEICDPLGGRTFDSKGSWGAVEEKKLLAAAYRYKLGNWGEVTKLMETNRPTSQVQEYYDRFFIRGPIGQFALKRLTWEETKRSMLADGTLSQHVEADRITYLLMVEDALKDGKTRLDPQSANLTNEIDDLVHNHMSRMHLDADESCTQVAESGVLDEVVDLALSDDSCDPSDVEETDKKIPEDAYSTGLEPEIDSDEEDTNMSTPSLRTIKAGNRTEHRSTRKTSRQGSIHLRPSKVRVRCGLRKSTREKSNRSSRYRRVMQDSSSTDEESASADENESMETDQRSVVDTHEPTHGLEKEHSTDDYTASESEYTKRPSKEFNFNSMKRKRRARFVSKKARRLKEFQKRMARMNKAAELRLNELSELCPADDIRALRDTKPNLALYTHDYVARPKVRQSDMDMLAYNASRNDFEWEWFNDAEQLISRLMVQESSDKVEDLENDIKFARLEKYNRILKARKAYRRAIVEHEKIPEFFRFMMNMTMEKRKASQIFEQRTALDKLLARAQQCLTKKEIEDLRNHIDKTNELMDRITKLQDLQRSGITTLKEAVLLMSILLWTHAIMESLPSLVFLNVVVGLYCRFAISSSLLVMKKKLRCSGKRNAQFRKDGLTCALESRIVEDCLIIEEVLIQGITKPSIMKMRLQNPQVRSSKPLRSFNLRARTFQSVGGTGSTARETHSSFASQSMPTYPVNVDAVLGANTVEDIADAHPDFARLLLDCYSAGCDLEEYKREFQRLKNLRIKRQGGVNQTLSFSLFPSVPSDLPGHLFVRLMKFHSVYEGACRKYLSEVVNTRAEASSAFSYDLSAIGVQDLFQGGIADDVAMANVSMQYPLQEYQFLEPVGLGQERMTAEVTYSPALNSAHTHMRRVSHSSARVLDGQQGMTVGTELETAYVQQGHGYMSQNTMLQGGSVDRRMVATPLPSWSVQQTSVNAADLRSQMATPLPPLEIRQCPVLQPGMAHSLSRVESRSMNTPVQHLQSRMSTPVARVESRHSYNMVAEPQSQQYQQMRSASVVNASGGDSRTSLTPLTGSSESLHDQNSSFATPTKKARARRKVVMASGPSSSQSLPAVTLQGCQMSATPIPGWQQQPSKHNVTVLGQSSHVQNRAVMSASVTPLQRQLTTPAPDHREMMSSTPLPGWGSGQSASQVEHSPLVSSLPPLSQYTSAVQQSRQLKTSYPATQDRRLVTPAPQSCEVLSQSSYEQPQLYTQSRDIMTPASFVRPDSVAVQYPQGQVMAGSTELYSQSALPSYQWSEATSMNVYQQGQYVQQQSYNQQSQFTQQINTGNQQTAFASQSSQYASHSVLPQQSQYPQGTGGGQKVSAFSQPYNYVQQSYSLPTYQQQSPFSQDSYAASGYPQRSPYAQQQQPAEQQSQRKQQAQSQAQQQNQTIQQQLSQPAQQPQHHQQQQTIQRQIYENSAQYTGFIPTYTTQSACMQDVHNASGTMQAHQITSCEIAQHVPEIRSQAQANFSQSILDIRNSSTGTIGEPLQNEEGVTPREANVSLNDSNFNSISENPMVNTLVEDEITFGVTQVPPPPRNDSEATVPARASPASVSPEFIEGEDETNSLIPTIFYSTNQNDLSDLRIQDSPLEKGLNCQHFRFDIILAMKHHRIGKEDYERTLQELDQMEKEKCVGPLGDMLMKRLGLKRQSQQSHGGKFSVDELVAAFAANASVRDRSKKIPERRGSSELFSEILNEIAHPSYGAPSLATESSAAHQSNEPNILQSGDANDLGFLLSDDVIAEFDSMSKAAKSAQIAESVPYSSIAQKHQSQTGQTGILQHRIESTAQSSSAARDPASAHLSSQKTAKHLVRDDRLDPRSSLSFGQPAIPARRSPDHEDISSARKKDVIAKIGPMFPSTSKGSRTLVTSIAAGGRNLHAEQSVGGKHTVEKTERKGVVTIGGPALPARRSDVFNQAEYEALSPDSPVVITPEPLSDEPEWWRKDETQFKSRTSGTAAVSAMMGTVFNRQSVDDPRSSARLEVRTSEGSKYTSARMEESFATQKSSSSGRADIKKTLVKRHGSGTVLHHGETLLNSDVDECEPSTSNSDLIMKRTLKKSKKYLSSDSSSESDKDQSPSAARLHSSEKARRSHSPHSFRSISPSSTKRKLKKGSLVVKHVKEAVIKSGLSKMDLSRELLAKQISEIIEEERCKLPPEEAKQLKRPLSPATLDVVIQDLMQHHISEDSSPNRELFASKLLGTDLFSKLFFRAGRCVFKHYEEMDDMSKKDKGKGSSQRRKLAGSRKRDTELLRGIRKSREIQKHRDAVRAAREPTEAEKAAAAERAKLEAMPWLARATFKPIVQQGSSSRFVIPKKSSAAGNSRQDISRDSSKMSRHSDSDAKYHPDKGKELSAVSQKSQNVEETEILKSSRSAEGLDKERVMFLREQRSPNRFEEVAVTFSFAVIPKSGLHKAKVKHIWPLKRWRSAAISLEEPVDFSSHHFVEEREFVTHSSASGGSHMHEDVADSGSKIERKIEEKSQLSHTEPSVSSTKAECASATEAELAALALQEELFRSEQVSPDDQFDALRYLAAMPESEFQVGSDEAVASTSNVVQNEVLPSKVETPASIAVSSKLFSPARSRDENQFEQADWMRIEQVPQPFFAADFDADPWRLPLPTTESLTPKHALESPQTAAVVSSSSLYSTLQEELDIIVRDTLGDTTYDRVISSTDEISQLKSGRFEWPKATVPIRSYALDVILPKLSCDKSRIPIIDMCRCERCRTRCAYFCDEDEWKYLYDRAVLQRNKQGSTDQNEDNLTEEMCSTSFSEKKSAADGTETSQFVRAYHHTSDNLDQTTQEADEVLSVAGYFCRDSDDRMDCLGIVRERVTEQRSASFAPAGVSTSIAQNFVNQSRCRGAKYRWPVHSKVHTSVSMSIATTSIDTRIKRPSACEGIDNIVPVYDRVYVSSTFFTESATELFDFERKEYQEDAYMLWFDYQRAVERVSFCTNAEPLSIPFCRGTSGRMDTRIVLPIRQKILIRCSLSTFHEPLSIILHRERPFAREGISIPLITREANRMSVVEVCQSSVKPSSFGETKATINVPRSSADSLSITCAKATFDQSWIAERTMRGISTALDCSRSEKVMMNISQVDVRRRKLNTSFFKEAVFAIPRAESSSLTCSTLTSEFLRTASSVAVDISLPLVVHDFTCYNSCMLRLHRRRPGSTGSAEIGLPVARSISESLNVCELIVERRRRAFFASIAISITIPRITTTSLTIIDASIEKKCRSALDSVVGVMPLARLAYSVYNAMKLNVRRKRMAQTSCAEKKLEIPRTAVASFCSTDLYVDYARPGIQMSVEFLVPIPRREDTILRISQLRVKRRRAPCLAEVERSEPIPRIDFTELNVLELTTSRQRKNEECSVELVTAIPRHYETAGTIMDCRFGFTRTFMDKKAASYTVDIPREEKCSTHILNVRVRRSRKQHTSHVSFTSEYADSDAYSLSAFESICPLTRKREPNELEQDSMVVVDIPRVETEQLRISTLKTSRKRKLAAESTTFVKKLALEDKADLYLTERNFSSCEERSTEVVYIKDPRLPERCSSTFMEVSNKWRTFAHQHVSNRPFSSHMVTQFATLLQRVFSGALNREAITMQQIHRMARNAHGRYSMDVFTDPQKVLISESVSSSLWNSLIKLRMQRNSTEILNRKVLSPLYLFLGIPNLPRVGRPWRKWLKPLEPTIDSKIGWQLALCMRIPDIVGVDDMDYKLQAIKMWWTIMMLKGTVPWSVYPCFSRRQLFLLVRLLEMLQDVNRPPFSLYPPKAFFKAVKKILRHPRIELIPKDVFHPDVTIMATLLKLKPNRVFQLDRSLPELLSQWLDDMNYIDAYLAYDVDIVPIPQSKFLTMTEWAWANYSQGCALDWIRYDRTVDLGDTIAKLVGCLQDVTLSFEQRRRISMLKSALLSFSKYDDGPDLNQVPIDIINPFALSASLISKIPMPDGFVDECFAFLAEVAKKSNRLRQNPTRKSTGSLLSWKWKPSERLGFVGKPTSDGTKVIGKTTISTIFEEFWRQKSFSTTSNISREESMALDSFNPHLSTNLSTCQLNSTNVHQPNTSSRIATSTQHSPNTVQSGITTNTETISQPVKEPNPHPHKKIAKAKSLQKPSANVPTNVETSQTGDRKRKELVYNEHTSVYSRPMKKSRIERRKRARVRASDEDSSPSAKQHMLKIPEHRLSKIRHTLARRGVKTEKMVHETVLRATALATAQKAGVSLPLRRSLKRQLVPEFAHTTATDKELSSSNTGKIKKSRAATLFDIANFEYVLEMSLRRPRTFVNLYKTMKYQYRIIEKRRWVEKNGKLYDSAQFDKFMMEYDHSEAKMLEKAKLLKAEKDMEMVLGISRADAIRMEKFSVKDIAHWYGMNAKYAGEARILISKTLEDASRLDSAIREVLRQEDDAEKRSKEQAWNAMSVRMNPVLERDASFMRGVFTERTGTLSGFDGGDISGKGDLSGYVLSQPRSGGFEDSRLQTSTLSLSGTNEGSLSGMNEGKVRNGGNAKASGDVMNIPHSRLLQISDAVIPPIFHMQSRIPITSAFVAVLLGMNLEFKAIVQFVPRFKRSRRVDEEIDLLPPGDFSPYSTDDEWEEYYEKKDRYENNHVSPKQLSWKSSGRAAEEDVIESASEPDRHEHCDCIVDLTRVREWVQDIECCTLWKSHSDCDLIHYGSHAKTLWNSLHQIPRSSSALSCVSTGKMPVLDLRSNRSTVSKRQRRIRSSSLPTKLHKYNVPRSASVPPSWKSHPEAAPESESRLSLSESRRDRLMYPRRLSACHFYSYGARNLSRRRRFTRKQPTTNRIPTRGQELPEQWIKRENSCRHDYLKGVRYRLQIKAQHHIPVVWCVRSEHNSSPIEEIEMDEEVVEAQPIRTSEPRECPLKYPIAVYNPPPNWNTFMEWKQREKRTVSLCESLDHPTEPSAFQRVLQRPQPIYLNRLDALLTSDDDERVPEWPLLRQLREMERELLAAGNPIAVERQRIREYNKKLRREAREKESVEERLRLMQRFYLEYFLAQQLFLAQDHGLSTGDITRTRDKNTAFKLVAHHDVPSGEDDDEMIEVGFDEPAEEDVAQSSTDDEFDDESADEQELCADPNLDSEDDSVEVAFSEPDASSHSSHDSISLPEQTGAPPNAKSSSSPEL